MKSTNEVIREASKYLTGLRGHVFDVINLSKPISPAAAVNLAKVVSKLSPLVGNMIEFNTCEFLNDHPHFAAVGRWIRQDPGFPDTIFQCESIKPTPGFEIKAWFPLATEITARFKDSQNHFRDDRTYVVMLAWLPEFLVYGRPKIVDIVIVSGQSVAKARDDHYHKPPDYVVIEPVDTTDRTRNLQQTNTNGFKWQPDADPRKETRLREAAQQLVASWGRDATKYSPTLEYQLKLQTLLGKFRYRLDTNFAKMDRIVHPEIEAFKERVYGSAFQGMTIGEWNRLLSTGSEVEIEMVLAERFEIRHEPPEKLIK